MSIVIMSGFKTFFEAEEHRNKLKDSDTFTVATLAQINSGESMGHFVLKNKVVDLLLTGEE